MRRNKSVYLWMTSAVLMFAFIFLRAEEPGKDHPLLSRYPGSRMIYYEQKDFSEFYLLKAPQGKGEYGLKDCKKFKVEGKVTKIIYALPRGKSAYEVFRNYETALKNAGFKVLAYLRTKWVRDFVEGVGFPDIKGFGSEAPKDHFYISARTPAGDVFVMVYVGEGYLGRPGKAAVGIVEARKMQTGLITANIMKQRLEATGHVALYGIYFDFNKAEIKPESEPTIKEIAKLLRENPKMKLYVVGHTDNVGSLDYNMELSKRRAEAVVKELVEKYGIAKDRLMAFGVGPLAPVASNKTEAGRAKNRRVELIEQ